VVHDPNDRREVAQKKAQAIIASEQPDRLPIGVFYRCVVPTYEEILEKKGVLRRDFDPATDDSPFKRDITPLLEALA
jgi:hypothetical protein